MNVRRRGRFETEGWFIMDPLSSQTGMNLCKIPLGYCQIFCSEYLWICFGAGFFVSASTALEI
jgi:hypothetical protein